MLKELKNEKLMMMMMKYEKTGKIDSQRDREMSKKNGTERFLLSSF